MYLFSEIKRTHYCFIFLWSKKLIWLRGGPEQSWTNTSNEKKEIPTQEKNSPANEKPIIRIELTEERLHLISERLKKNYEEALSSIQMKNSDWIAKAIDDLDFNLYDLIQLESKLKSQNETMDIITPQKNFIKSLKITLLDLLSTETTSLQAVPTLQLGKDIYELHLTFLDQLNQGNLNLTKLDRQLIDLKSLIRTKNDLSQEQKNQLFFQIEQFQQWSKEKIQNATEKLLKWQNYTLAQGVNIRVEHWGVFLASQKHQTYGLDLNNLNNLKVTSGLKDFLEPIK